MTKIREAAEQDNDALIELQKQCPQGTSLVLGIDSSPDYFARSKSFKDWHVFVAIENDNIVGSAACAIRDTFVEGKQLKTAYEYGFIVDPHHRRKGIAVQLQRHIEQIALDEDTELLHLNVTEDNLPSINLFSKMGFVKVKDCTVFSLMAYRRQKIASEMNIRSMEKTDVDKVVDLVNETYRDYSFFTPFQTGDFAAYVKRMPYFDFHNIVVFGDNKDVKACLGYWDYNKVMKYIIHKFNWRLKAQTFLMRLGGMFTQIPVIPKLGQPLLGYNLTTPAYKTCESITDLIKHVINKALENRISFLYIPLDPESEIASIISQFRHTKVKLHFFIKPLKQQRFPDLRKSKLYIDVSDI